MNLTSTFLTGKTIQGHKVYPTAAFCDLINGILERAQPTVIAPAPGPVTSPFASDLEPPTPKGMVEGIDCPHRRDYYTGVNSRAWWMVEAAEQGERADEAEAQVRTLTAERDALSSIQSDAIAQAHAAGALEGAEKERERCIQAAKLITPHDVSYYGVLGAFQVRLQDALAPSEVRDGQA